MTAAVQAEIKDLARWLELDLVLPLFRSGVLPGAVGRGWNLPPAVHADRRLT